MDKARPGQARTGHVKPGQESQARPGQARPGLEYATNRSLTVAPLSILRDSVTVLAVDAGERTLCVCTRFPRTRGGQRALIDICRGTTTVRRLDARGSVVTIQRCVDRPLLECFIKWLRCLGRGEL